MPPPCSPMFSDEDGRALLGIARQAILQALLLATIPDLPSPCGRLAEPAGAFVTLRLNGKIRGCVGRVDPADSLAEIVAQCAMTAALADPRFKPVTAEEMKEAEIEISVLSRPWPVRPEEIELGNHGIIVSRGAVRGLLLPQVAVERRWSSAEFLDAACCKAGLQPGVWHDPETNILAFTAEVFSESSLVAIDEKPW
jgi:AmmeMemoRadiSam system protein A